MKKPSEKEWESWMRQWRYAARELPELKWKELRELTPERLLARIDAVLAPAGDPAYRDPDRWTTSGLVEQQALFQKLRKR